jgi:1-acyl-sn-glycerol-3-phosphate acyltransferase
LEVLRGMLYAVRLLLMGLLFIGVGLIGLLVGLCRPFHPDNSRLFARLYAYPATRLLGMRLEAEVAELHAQPPGFVMIANHQSNYDLFLLGNIVPRRTVAIGKKSLGLIPLFGQLFWLGGNVLVNRDNPHQARRALQLTSRTLRDKATSIWIFPEGTRNQAEQLLPFKKGAFHMAIDAGVPIVQVCVSRYPKGMQLNRWRSGRAMVRSLPAIETAGLTQKDIPELARRCREQMQQCIDAMDNELRGA